MSSLHRREICSANQENCSLVSKQGFSWTQPNGFLSALRTYWSELRACVERAEIICSARGHYHDINNVSTVEKWNTSYLCDTRTRLRSSAINSFILAAFIYRRN